MKSPYWIIIFLALLVTDIVAVQTGQQLQEKIVKPLLIPVLIIYFLNEIRNRKLIPLAGRLKTWVLLALFFSWAGDVLLLFQDKDPVFFLAGLSSFLLAHIFYIIFFHSVRVSENVGSKPVFLIILVIYYAGLIWWLNPYLGDMKIPVRIYGIVISFMFMLALHMMFIPNKLAGRCMMLGALLFVLSDTILAINKFYKPFDLSGLIIMLTYGFAQLLIVTGAIYYIRNKSTP